VAEDPTITGDTVLKRSDELLSSELDGETVMMSIESGKYYGLEEIATRIWELIEQPTSVSALCDTLVSEFDVAREQCEADVLPFLAELAKEGVVEVVDEKAE